MKPAIGITCDFDWETGNSQLRPGYFEGVYRSGGLPFLIPALEPSGAADILSRLDGLLLTGGQDIDPKYFGEDPHPAIGNVNPYRDELEIALCREALERHIPVFGVCRGVQLMNVALGGSLYQDLNSQGRSVDLMCHNQPAPKWYGFHEIRIQDGTRLMDILETDRARTNSFHHQAVRRLGRSLIASAHTGDGIIEAIESEDHPYFIGVQWHPERMLEDKIMIKLFEAFIKAARGTAQ